MELYLVVSYLPLKLLAVSILILLAAIIYQEKMNKKENFLKENGYSKIDNYYRRNDDIIYLTEIRRLRLKDLRQRVWDA